MQQVVDLQNDKAFKKLGVELLAVSPDPTEAWRKEGGALGVTVPELSDSDNEVWLQYGTPDWMMTMTGEPGHTFFLVGSDDKVAWVRDYGAPEHGGAMYVTPAEIAAQIKEALAG
jgi:peroxiredoxin